MSATKKGSSSKPSTSSSAASASKKFIIDFSAPANDSVFDGDAYLQFMKERIKVDGKAGQLGDKVSVSKEGEGKLVVTANGPFSKRYLKYLTKKYLKKNNMRDWLRVVASSKQAFSLKYYNIATNAGDDEVEQD